MSVWVWLLLFSILGGILYLLDLIHKQLWDLNDFLRKQAERAHLQEIEKRIAQEQSFARAVSQLRGGQ